MFGMRRSRPLKPSFAGLSRRGGFAAAVLQFCQSPVRRRVRKAFLRPGPVQKKDAISEGSPWRFPCRLDAPCGARFAGTAAGGERWTLFSGRDGGASNSF